MKQATLILAFSVLSMATFAQAKKDSTHKKIIATKTHDSDFKVTSGDSTKIPIGTVIFALNPEQVQLLEFVISKSDAGFEKTNVLIQILKTQQYKMPTPTPPAKDSSSQKKE